VVQELEAQKGKGTEFLVGVERFKNLSDVDK
jgi:hypothetical protein